VKRNFTVFRHAGQSNATGGSSPAGARPELTGPRPLERDLKDTDETAWRNRTQIERRARAQSRHYSVTDLRSSLSAAITNSRTT
jgi:hypothetical protein